MEWHIRDYAVRRGPVEGDAQKWNTVTAGLLSPLISTCSKKHLQWKHLIVMVAPNISCQLTCHSPGSLPGKAKEEKPAERCGNANLWIFQEEQELSLPFALALIYHWGPCAALSSPCSSRSLSHQDSSWLCTLWSRFQTFHSLEEEDAEEQDFSPCL